MDHRPLAAVVLAFAMGAASIVGACSSDDPTPAPTGGGTTSGSTRISAAAGGIVADPSGRTSLSIPPGALAKDTDITLAITPKSSSALVEISDFGPDGLTFLKPATLSIKGDAALAPSGKSLAIAVGEGAEFKPIEGSTYANGAATASITHFSKYTLVAVGGAPIGDAGPIGDGAAEAGTDASTSGGITQPASGKAVINAAFAGASMDYSGSAAPFTGVESEGTAGSSVGAARWSSADGVTAPVRRVFIQLQDIPALEAGKTYTATKTPGTSGTSIRYGQGQGWICDGSINVTAVGANNKQFSFTFATTSCTVEVPPAVGSMTISGEGKATHF